MRLDDDNDVDFVGHDFLACIKFLVSEILSHIFLSPEKGGWLSFEQGLCEAQDIYNKQVFI